VKDQGLPRTPQIRLDTTLEMPENTAQNAEVNAGRGNIILATNGKILRLPGILLNQGKP